MENIIAGFAGQGYGKLKDTVADIVIATLEPIQKEHKRLMADRGYLLSILDKNAEIANRLSKRVLHKVQRKVGFADRVKK